VLSLIETWGKRFQRDHDIMPLFTDVYNKLLEKGIEFPSSQPSTVSASQPGNTFASAEKDKKSVVDLSPKFRKIVEEMNLLKGNINFTNECLDQIKSVEALRHNDTVTDLVKALKDMEPKLFELIQSCEDEDIMAICLLVNEDMQKTFERYKAIKKGQKPPAFMPGEYTEAGKVHYLEPTHIYEGKVQQSSPAPPKEDLFDMLAGGNPEPKQQTSASDYLSSANTIQNDGFGKNNDPLAKLNMLLQADQHSSQTQGPFWSSMSAAQPQANPFG
jgi:hypothetical protein